MAKSRPGSRGAQPPGQGGSASGRQPLVPSTPLPGWLALVQIALLLGLPISLLLVARVILRRFFPELGY
jgi:hypothetical protein